MEKVVHLNYYTFNGDIYCEQTRSVVKGDEHHYNEYCFRCPYFAGSLQGDGVECVYEDSTVKPGETLVVVQYPTEYAIKRADARDAEEDRRRTNFVVKE